MNDIVKFDSILNKVADEVSISFRTIDKKAITKICEWLPEVSRGVSCFSKQNSQTTSSLMTLNMIDAGPYRILRQILAQAEKKKSALAEILYKTEKKNLKVKRLLKTLEESNGLETKEIELEISKILYDVDASQPIIEASMKELGALKLRYEEVMKNNNIPENWDEADFERAEIEHHIKSAFRNAVRDRMQGAPNMGTMEYMEQMGLNPITAYALVDQYIGQCRQSLNEGKGPDINAHYNFFDQMYELFKDEYKKAMKRIGLDSITHAEYLMKENK